MAKKIKILSGWSAPGGSTVALVNLCNLFNERGYDCTFYGPHDWHLSKCKADYLQKCPLNEKDEILLVHYLTLPQRPDASDKVILACHEKDVYPIAEQKKFWDKVVYVSESQKEWQSKRETSPVPKLTLGEVIPNVLPDLHPSTNMILQVAGVIGSIDANKKTHRSIERALEDGYKDILLYGMITEEDYFTKFVKPLMDDNPGVKHLSFCDNKQQMYDSVSKVYHSSASETFNYVKAECNLTGTIYDGLDSAESGAEVWTNTKILKAWEKLLNLS